MKRYFLIPLAAALVWTSACSKPQSDAERNAEIERQVQQRLAAQTEQQAATQRAADLDAREKALAAREAATPIPEAVATPEPRRASNASEDNTTSGRSRTREVSNDGASGSYNTFYTKLERYGDWMETADYGYVFRPHDAENSRKWRPYTNGRWVHTEAGWTWVSEEPFGWATYHYGRWTRLENVGWVWVPGEQWAPAWVSWRTGDNYVGWAPLPPEAHFDRQTGIHNWSDNYYDIGPTQYAFVASVDLGSTNLERNVVPADQNVTIINRTTNITNITYNNTTVVNSGPNYDQYRGLSREPIQSLRLERRTSDNGPDARTVIRGEVVEMPAPFIRANQAAERPRTLQQTLTNAVVDHGWSGLNDQNAVRQMRAKMNAEAAPPAGLPSKTFVKPMTAGSTAPTVPAASGPLQATKPAPIPSLPPGAAAPDLRSRQAAIEQQKAAQAVQQQGQIEAQKKAQQQQQAAAAAKVNAEHAAAQSQEKAAADQAAKSNAQRQMEDARRTKATEAAQQQGQIEAQKKAQQQQQAAAAAKVNAERAAAQSQEKAAADQAAKSNAQRQMEDARRAKATEAAQQQGQIEAQKKAQQQQQAEAAQQANAARAEQQREAAGQQKIQQQQAEAARRAAPPQAVAPAPAPGNQPRAPMTRAEAIAAAEKRKKEGEPAPAVPGTPPQ